MTDEIKDTDKLPFDNMISGPMREAERSIGLSMSRLGKMGPGGGGAWVGAWGEYKRLGQLMIKTRALADRIEKNERMYIRDRKRWG